MMLRLRVLVFAFALAAGLSGFASAQVVPSINYGMATTTTAALVSALKSKHDAQAARAALAAAPDAEDTPPPPITEKNGDVIGFPKGVSYFASITSSFPYGDVGEPRNTLPGGFNAMATARVEPRTNVFAEYFQLDAQILSIDNGVGPLYIAGQPKPGGVLPLAQLHEGVATKVDAFIAGFQRLFFVGGSAINGGHPVVLAPTYAAVKSDIGGGFLNFQQQYNPFASPGKQVQTIQQRVFQQFDLNLAIPLSLTEKLNVIYFATPEILVHPDGFNLTNHVQFEQMLLAQYNPNPVTTIFFNPSLALTYFPTDTYPVRTFSIIYGISHRLTKPASRTKTPLFIQGEVITSNPDNPIDNRLGVARITIVPTKAGGSLVLPTIGGNKFTTVQVSVGVGSPPVVIPYP